MVDRVVSRSCPLCAHPLEVVRADGEVRRVCTACWAAWLPRTGALRFPSDGTPSRMPCPQCEGTQLVGGGRTAQGDLWRCPACGGVLMALSPTPTPLPAGASPGALLLDGAIEFVAWALGIIVAIAVDTFPPS